MKTPGVNEIKAVSSLLHDRDFQIFIEWIKESYIKQSFDLNKLQGESVLRQQGRNLELEDLQKYFKKDFLENELRKHIK